MTTNVDAVSAGNKHIVCQNTDNIATLGILKRNPLNYSLPLILLQFSLISVTSQMIEFCLQPLGQSSIVAQILGGVMYGPSALGNDALIGMALFPTRSVLTLETAALFGISFFFFAIGVKSDSRMMIRPGRRAAAIGISAMIFTMVLTISFAFLLKKYVHMDDSLSSSLLFLAASQGLTAFPNIACLLAELNLSSSDLGRIATASSMLCDIFGMGVVAIILGIVQSGSDPVKSALSLISMFLFVIGMVYVAGPIIRMVLRSIPTGKPLPDRYVFFCFAGTLVSAFLSEVIGQHFVLGPLVFGLLVPDGQPLGAPIISKIDYPVGKFLYPTFLTTSGLKTNIFKIDLWSLLIMILLIVFSCISKIAAVAFSSRFFDVRFKDSVVIGLMLNARGLCELIVYNLLRDTGVLTEKEFALSVISVIGVTAVITPLIRLLYDPSKQYLPSKRRTIQHMRSDAELRILVCIKNQENVPSIVNLLEASDATEESPIAVLALILVELVGRTTPMLVAHQSTQTLQPTNSHSGHILGALHQYELCHENCVTVQSFSVFSHLHTTQDDICRVASNQKATIIILPFHKLWEIDGSIGSQDKAVQNMNIKVMDKAPCSVGILVDRGILTGSLSILNSQSIYQVAVIYIGGPDDAESLFYAARMARRNNVSITILRFLLFGCDTARERKHDNNLIDEVRQDNMLNQNNLKYQERVVKDGVGLAASLRSLDSTFNLLIVGRHHNASQILMGLGAWSECPELGVVGDILASPDFASTASVLVVQQQKLHGEKLGNRRMMRPMVVNHELMHDPTVPAVAATSTSNMSPRLEISIDRE
ncbi:Cation/H(+) antiporter 15 [Sesamum alatum]|uniref:Cation/H(+) antiporter 15 n=1 Tax=Sesamum alatum TaxID=300844 RepID=A0AAE1YU27_9LAMI|nr:Cation/H(+) antiporter 15 [Sesamum alatum]